MEEFICQFCGEVRKSRRSLSQHQVRCAQNPKRRGIVHANRFTKAKELGLPKPAASNQFIKAEQLGQPKPKGTTKGMHIRHNQNSDSWKGKSLPEEMRKKISARVSKKVLDGTWHMQFRHQRIFRYKGYVLQSTWEYLYARFLDREGIPWERASKAFKYFYEGKERLYHPDFYLPDKDLFIEIKGVETDQDRAKWAAFPEKLEILREEELKQLGIPIGCSEKTLLEY